MKKRNFIAFMLLLLIFVGARILPAHAAESTPAPTADAKPAAAPKEAEGKSGEDGKNKKPADVSGGRFAGDPIYVHLAPMTLPIIGNTGPEQLVTVQITVEVKDQEAADNLHENMPRVMDALMRGLYGGLDSGSLRSGRMVNVGKVKNKAMNALQTVAGTESIKDVLITNMSQRLL